MRIRIPKTEFVGMENLRGNFSVPALGCEERFEQENNVPACQAGCGFSFDAASTGLVAPAALRPAQAPFQPQQQSPFQQQQAPFQPQQQQAPFQQQQSPFQQPQQSSPFQPQQSSPFQTQQQSLFRSLVGRPQQHQGIVSLSLPSLLGQINRMMPRLGAMMQHTMPEQEEDLMDLSPFHHQQQSMDPFSQEHAGDSSSEETESEEEEEQAGLAIKNPQKKTTQKTHPEKTHPKKNQKTPKKPTKNFFLFFKFFFFMKIIQRFFYEQIRQTIIDLQKNIKVPVCTQLRIFQKEIKIDTQSRDDACIRRKRLISKSDYNLKSGCT
jgi:hypothetical protein